MFLIAQFLRRLYDIVGYVKRQGPERKIVMWTLNNIGKLGMLLIRLTLLSLLFGNVSPLRAQTSVDFPPDGPSRVAYEWRMEPSTGLPQYACVARGTNPTSIFAVTTSQSTGLIYGGLLTHLTQIVVSGSTATITLTQASGLDVGHRLTISGSSSSALNAGWTVTSTDPTSTVVTVSLGSVSVPAGTYNNAGLRVLTGAPRRNAEIWGVQRFFYNGSTFIRSAWAYGETAMNKSCSSASAYWQ